MCPSFSVAKRGIPSNTGSLAQLSVLRKRATAIEYPTI